MRFFFPQSGLAAPSLFTKPPLRCETCEKTAAECLICDKRGAYLLTLLAEACADYNMDVIHEVMELISRGQETPPGGSAGPAESAESGPADVCPSAAANRAEFAPELVEWLREHIDRMDFIAIKARLAREIAERQREGERRSGTDRRADGDRRKSGARWFGVERRSGADRRKGGAT
ncbi:MAG: hypothetical protein LBU58_04005 [Clostridiales bacterium]|jgi:hypothetical protein|nr:hypothetical protein [Clostridiales bacterium]